MKNKFSWERFGELLIVMVVSLVGGFIMSSFFFVAVSYQDTSMTFVNLVSGVKYKQHSALYINDTFISEVVDFCSPFGNETQVECVVNYVDTYYNYTNHSNLFNRPDEFVKIGGVCRDVALVYDSVFTRLGWWNEFRFDEPQHVYNVISNRNMLCIVDGGSMRCM